jgi:putative FmdB family regulatory protein
MPIYDYRCDHCGHAFSAVQPYKDESLERCPSCGKRPRRLIASPAIVFKGSGWYSTDSRKKASGDTAAADGATAEPKAAEKPGEKPVEKPPKKPPKKPPEAEAAS